MIDIEHHQDLIDYLVDRGLLATTARPECRNLLGGVSNRTVLVDNQGAENWVVKQALEKLRVETDWFSDPARIHHEAQGLRWLATLVNPEVTPAFVYEDHDLHILIMKAVKEPHFNYKTVLLDFPPETNHARQFAELLAAIHRNSFHHKEQVAPVFADTTFFENLRLDPYYAYSAAQVPEAKQFLSELISQTRSRKLTLVHGDYSPKNVLVHNNRLVLLDHEVIHFGDPGFDIGFSMAHFLGKAHFRTPLRSEFINIALFYWRTYYDQIGSGSWTIDLEQTCVKHTMGCMMARAAGKSVLEYLSTDQRSAQKQMVLKLIEADHRSMAGLINHFSTLLDNHE